MVVGGVSAIQSMHCASHGAAPYNARFDEAGGVTSSESGAACFAVSCEPMPGYKGHTSFGLGSRGVFPDS